MRFFALYTIAIMIAGGNFLPVVLYGAEDSAPPGNSSPDTTHIIWWRAGTASAFSLGMLYLSWNKFQQRWGKSHGKFHFKTKDWSGDGLAQGDEISHAIAAQRLCIIGREMARWVGFSEHSSTIWGAAISGAVTTWVEFPVDAFNPGQGVGYTDLAANATGIALYLVRERYDWAHRFDLRFSYISFADSLIPPEIFVGQNYRQYDNAIYWLVYYPSPEKIPLNLGIGYSTTRNYDPRYDDDPIREWYLGAGFSVTDLAKPFGIKTPRILELLDTYEFSLYVQIK